MGEPIVGKVVAYVESKGGEWVPVGQGFQMRWAMTMECQGDPLVDPWVVVAEAPWVKEGG